MEKYIINKEIGSGSFGKIFVVEARKSGIQYVVKQINLSKLTKKQRSLAEKETQVLAKLKHPHIVSYKEAYSDDWNLHIIMELCESGDLHERIQRAREDNTKFSDQQIMEYFVQICLALDYIHKQQIIHRDVKTKNIFLTKGNVVKLGDFGVAKVLENSLELAQTCVGSPFYLSPEICENQPYDKKSDVWSLGCVLFELTTLRYAFTANNMKTLLAKIAQAQHNPLPANTCRDIKILLGRLLRSNSKQRPSVEDILSTPFLIEHRRRQSSGFCRKLIKLQRSKSGETIRQKPTDWAQCPGKARALILFSKSSLNLTSPSITEPKTKYSRKIKSCEQDLKFSKEVGRKSCSQVVKLPKADCKYLKMLEKPESRSRDVVEVKTSNKTNIGSILTAECPDMHKSSRKRWTTTTAEKNELIEIMNNVKLSEDNVIQQHTRQIKTALHREVSIDDILSMGTTDISHIPVLLPKQADAQNAITVKNDGDLMWFNSTIEYKVDDRTFVISSDVDKNG